MLRDRSPLIRYAPGVLAAFFAICVIGAFTKEGKERGELLFYAVMIAAVASPFVLRRHPRLQGAAMVFKFLVGFALCLAGVAGFVFSIVLFKAGSYGILGGMVFLPLSLGALVFGWTLMMLPAVPPPTAGAQNAPEGS